MFHSYARDLMNSLTLHPVEHAVHVDAIVKRGESDVAVGKCGQVAMVDL